MAAPNMFDLSSMAAGFSGRSSSDLFGGQQLQDQVNQETDEQRRKRLKLMQQQSGGVTATQSGSVLGGLSVPALFGNYGR